MLIAFIVITPMVPPMMPPTAWSPAHPKTPPHCIKACDDMKNNPITKPAKAAEKTEVKSSAIEPMCLFSNKRLYPIKNVSISNTMDAAKKPKKWRAYGLTIRLITNAINPTKVAVPIFLDHHTARINAAKPMRSQAKGRWNIRKNSGDIVTFRTPHKAAKIAIPVKSRGPKYT